MSRREVNRVEGGQVIDYGTKVNFTFNGRRMTGRQGDTVASALLANGQRLVTRSFKYGRPRGIVSAGVEEPNAIFQLGAGASQVPNIRGTEQEIYEGLRISSTNGWPSLRLHLMGFVGRLAGRFMPAGFYYKTFLFPAFLWRTYEYFIRQAAGLGRAPKAKDPDSYDKLNHHPDILIVGGGPAGLMAALAAQPSGARIMLVDEGAHLGGSLLHSRQAINGEDGRQWAASTAEQLASAANVTLLGRTTVVGYHDQGFLTGLEKRTDHLNASSPDGRSRQRMHRIRAKQVVLATGAQERPLVFANNDLPGCMQASAISAYRHQYGVVPGQRLVVMTTNDQGYQAALDWQDAGREVVAIVDSRLGAMGRFKAEASARGIRQIESSAVIEAKGRLEVSAAVVAKLSKDKASILGDAEVLKCDTIASSGGWSPVVHLSCHTGRRPVWSAALNCFLADEAGRQGMTTAGAVTGILNLSHALATGFKAAEAALDGLGLPSPAPVSAAVAGEEASGVDSLFLVPHYQPVSRAPKQFVDPQLDVSAADIELAAREGFESIEHIKRYTALGFGTDQGKLSNVNGIAIAARATGRTMAETGTTMFRPNYTPVAFGAIVGRDLADQFAPNRYTAMQPWHEAAGARFEIVGQWQRPWYYPKAGEAMRAALNRECLAVRQQLGILDASTLGKIDIQGPDAREFLGRVYTNGWQKLKVGSCRYGLMCGEDGMVMDDGVTACLGDNHFLMHTSTGGAARVLEWLELWRQTEWPQMRVHFNSVTDHWATATITGPNARKLLTELTDLPISHQDFPFMQWRTGEVAGVPARIFRISFTGELSYEINVQANYGLRLWQALMDKGEQYGITPYGTEAMHLLRAEKGFIIVGQDTDGSVTPEDLGMGWAVNRKKPFSFIGKRGMARADCLREGRKQLVGLLPARKAEVLPEGGQLVWDKRQAVPMDMVGHVTSSYYSPTLRRGFALALVKDGRNRMGQTIYVPGVGGTSRATITEPIFYDPAGERQNVE